jgi:anaerobic selenocysteine-containing dehydrogenase
LERLNYSNTTALFEGIILQQPVVPPMYNSRSAVEILWEIADRGGWLTGPAGMLMMINYGDALSGLCSFDGPWPFDPDRKYSWEEFVDVACRTTCGLDLAWFKEHGHNLRPVPPERYYYRWGWNQHRLPFYFTELKARGDELRQNMERDRVKEKIGLDPDVWCRQFNALPTWEASIIHEEDPEYDMYVSSRRTPMSRGSTLPATNPWLMEIAERDPYHLKIRINSETAKKKGLKDGDLVWVESKVARVQGRLKLTECMHHETLGFTSNLGHWMKHSVAQGKGPNVNKLLPLDLEHTAPVAPSLEGTAKVKIYKA